MISGHPYGRAYKDLATGTAPRAGAAWRTASGFGFLRAGSLSIAVCPAAERRERFGGNRCGHIGISNREGEFSSAFGSLRSRCLSVRNMGPLGQPAAKGNVLAWR